jgi:PWWP domain
MHVYIRWLQIIAAEDILIFFYYSSVVDQTIYHVIDMTAVYDAATMQCKIGDIVWVKSDNFRQWPAIITDRNCAPKHIYTKALEVAQTHVLVLYFEGCDKERTYGFIKFK